MQKEDAGAPKAELTHCSVDFFQPGLKHLSRGNNRGKALSLQNVQEEKMVLFVIHKSFLPLSGIKLWPPTGLTYKGIHGGGSYSGPKEKEYDLIIILEE